MFSTLTRVGTIEDIFLGPYRGLLHLGMWTLICVSVFLESNTSFSHGKTEMSRQ